jgi:uncharacterized protein
VRVSSRPIRWGTSSRSRRSPTSCRRRYAGRATETGGWWGPALHARRLEKSRFTEEIDTVVVAGRTVVAVAEAKWTNKPMDAAVLTSLVDHKLPAMRQAGFDVADTEIILTSRSGFTDGVRRLSTEHPTVRLWTAADLLDQSGSGSRGR